MTIEYPPSSDFDSLNNLGAGALASLDKIFNPYEPEVLNTIALTTISAVTVLSKVLTCDDITLDFVERISDSAHYTRGYATLNGVIIYGIDTYSGSNSESRNLEKEFKNVKGKTLIIYQSIVNGSFNKTYILKERTLKA